MSIERTESRVVVSAVNFVEGGPLKVLQDILVHLSSIESIESIALVNDAVLVDNISVNAVSYPEPKKSWSNRLNFEWRESRKISEELNPDIWISLHDITPLISVGYLAVYCHNPAPLYKCSLREAWLDPKFFAFNMLYGKLYAINIHKADVIIVQQDWLRDAFKLKYGHNNIIVAYPGGVDDQSIKAAYRKNGSMNTFFYPAFPRVFKNFELLGDAARLLDQDPRWKGRICVTLSGNENRYAAWLRRRYENVRSLEFIGLQDRAGMDAAYRNCDALIFPSKLETWGLPLSEAKQWGLPLIAADLRYARETVGSYGDAIFIDPNDARSLADLLLRINIYGWQSAPVSFAEPAAPFARGWSELINQLRQGAMTKLRRAALSPAK